MKKKHIFLRVSIILLIIGFIIVIVGLFLGGRPGGFQLTRNQFIYRTINDTYVLWERENNFILPTPESSSGIATSGPSAHDTTGENSGNTNNVLGFSASDITKLSVEIDAGYINIISGSEPGLTVDGSLPYKTSFENGKWKIKTDVHVDDITTVGSDENTRFYLNGQDVTTTYTITIPENLEKVELKTGLGILSTDSIVAKELSVDIAMGSATVANSTAKKTKFTTNMGYIETLNLTTTNCQADTSMGAIKLDGTITKSFRSKTSMGSVIVNMPKVENYSWKAEDGMGTVLIDNRKISGKGTVGTGNDFDFDLDASMGSIKVFFTK